MRESPSKKAHFLPTEYCLEKERKGSKKVTTFGNTYEVYEKLYFPEQNHLLFGKSDIPYIGNEFTELSTNRKSQNFAAPKNNRGLLSLQRETSPGPGSYVSTNMLSARSESFMTKSQAAWPKATRNIPFARFGSKFNPMIYKGIY